MDKGKEWITSRTHRGVRFREHPTRSHGVRPDRYFMIRFQVGGQRREEALGWASEGWSEQRAFLEMAKLKEAAKTGEGPASLAEKRAAVEAKRQAEAEEAARLERENVTLEAIWPGYLEVATATKKPESVRRELDLWRLWISPALGRKALRKITALDLERMKKSMADAGRAPRSIQYALAVVRQIFNYARKAGFFEGDHPIRQVSKTKVVNQRVRFLTPEEAGRLLEALAGVSMDVHDQTLLSLYCGCRWGEVISLTWGQVDAGGCCIHLLDTKSGQRSVPMPSEVQVMLERRRGEAFGVRADSMVFPTRSGVPVRQVSESFNRTVNALGFNEGLTDRRQRVCFHTMRHSYASWLVMAGAPLYTVAKLMGHSTLSMTERYAHLAPDHVREAVASLEAFGKARAGGKVVRLGGGTK